MRNFFYSGLALLLFSCNQETKKFDILNDQSTYQLIAFDGNGVKPTEGQYIAAYLTIVDSLGDTIHYVPAYHYFIEYYNESPIYEILSELSVGDSAHFQVSEGQLYDAFSFDRLTEGSTKKIELRIKAEYLVDEDRVKDTLMDELSQRIESEEQLIWNYLNNDIDPQAYYEQLGIYKKNTLKSIDGNQIKMGDRVTLEYEGSFLNGYVFDRKLGPDALEITYGMSDQILSGLSIGIKGMRAGESVKIILPSHHAFGGRGSIKGIVPPYTPVVYNLSIKNVTRTDNNEKERN